MAILKIKLAGLRGLAKQSPAGANDRFHERTGKDINSDVAGKSSHTAAQATKAQRPDWYQSIHGTDQ